MHWEREDIRVFIESLRHRPELRRRLVYISVGSFIVLAVSLLLFLTWMPAPKRPARPAHVPAGQGRPAPELTGVYAAAERLEPQLRKDRRFAGVVLVPTAAGAGRAQTLMVMGTVGSQADVDALRAIVEPGAGVGLDWRVTVAAPPTPPR